MSTDIFYFIFYFILTMYNVVFKRNQRKTGVFESPDTKSWKT